MNYETATLCAALTSTAGSVGALTVLADSVYIVRHNVGQVEVYSAKELTLKRCVPVPGLGAQVFGLVAYGSHVFVSDWDNECVHRVSALAEAHSDEALPDAGSESVDGMTDKVDDDAVSDSANKAVAVAGSKWLVGSQPAGLSLTPANNILVTCHGAAKLQEFSTEGERAREIRLSDDVVRLAWHAVLLSSGLFVVSHEGCRHGVSLVAADGRVVSSYAACVGEMQYPRGIVVADNGSTILVADQCNNRIVALNGALTAGQQLAVAVDGGLRWPYSLHLDESEARLLVCEWDGGRLLAFNNVKHINTATTAAA